MKSIKMLTIDFEDVDELSDFDEKDPNEDENE